MARPTHEEVNDEEVTDEALKAGLEQGIEELGGTPSESPTEEKPTPDASSEDVKPVAGVVKEVKKEVSEAVPYSRFKEIQEEKERLRLELEQLRTQKVEPKVSQPDPDDLTEEEKLYFDEAQLKVIEKIGNKIRKQAEKESQAHNEYWTQANGYFKKAQEKFPDLAKKESELWKKADQIVKDKYTQWSADKKTYYIPPNAQWLAALEANEEIREEKERIEKATKEEKANSKQNVMVDTKGKKAPFVRKASDEDTDGMSSSEMEKAMREEFEKNQEAQE